MSSHLNSPVSFVPDLVHGFLPWLLGQLLFLLRMVWGESWKINDNEGMGMINEVWFGRKAVGPAKVMLTLLELC